MTEKKIPGEHWKTREKRLKAEAEAKKDTVPTADVETPDAETPAPAVTDTPEKKEDKKEKKGSTPEEQWTVVKDGKIINTYKLADSEDAEGKARRVAAKIGGEVV